MTRGIMGDYESYIQIMYQNWYKTQTETYPIQEEYLCSWLMNAVYFYKYRRDQKKVVIRSANHIRNATGREDDFKHYV